MENPLQSQFDILNSKPSFFKKERLEDKLSALDKISESGVMYDVYYVLPHVFSNNNEISLKAAKTIRILFERDIAQKSWLSLYSRFSCVWLQNGELTIKDLDKLQALPSEDRLYLYGIATLNHNGYMRQAALEHLTTLTEPNALPFILLRLNDWVEQVRNSAKQALYNTLPKLSPKDIVRHYGLVEWLEKTQRIRLGDIQTKIFEHLTSNQNTLFEVMKISSCKEKLLCWKALKGKIKESETLLDKAINDEYAEVRVWATQNLLVDSRFEGRLLKLLSDKSVRVRYAALKTIPQNRFSDFKIFFEKSLSDNSISVREYSRFVIKSMDTFDFASFYRIEYNKNPSSASNGLIAGICETGNDSDLPVLLSCVTSKKAPVRASCLSGLNRLRAKGVDNIYLSALNDDNSKVRNVAVNILTKDHAELIHRIEELLVIGSAKTKKSALKILAQQNAATALIAALTALNQEEDLKNEGWQHLSSWYGQHAVRLWIKIPADTYQEIMSFV